MPVRGKRDKNNCKANDGAGNPNNGWVGSCVLGRSGNFKQITKEIHNEAQNATGPLLPISFSLNEID